MVYQEKMVVCVKDALGRVLREVRSVGPESDTVLLPFGAEYSLFFKNLGVQRAVVSVSVDGKDVLSGNALVLSPGEDVNLEGAMEGDTVRYRFKTAQKTAEVVQTRGDSVEHGLIQVTFRYEVAPVLRREPSYSTYSSDERLVPRRSRSAGGASAGSDPLALNDASPREMLGAPPPYETWGESPRGAYPACGTMDFAPKPAPEEVVTVAGSETLQQFNRVSVGVLGEPHKVIIRLRGDVDGIPVVAPVDVKRDVRCMNCGTRSVFGTNFCPKCGNNLRSSRPL